MTIFMCMCDALYKRDIFTSSAALWRALQWNSSNIVFVYAPIYCKQKITTHYYCQSNKIIALHVLSSVWNALPVFTVQWNSRSNSRSTHLKKVYNNYVFWRIQNTMLRYTGIAKAYTAPCIKCNNIFICSLNNFFSWSYSWMRKVRKIQHKGYQFYRHCGVG